MLYIDKLRKRRKLKGVESRKPRMIIYELFLVLCTCVFLYPFYMIVCIAVKSKKDILFHALDFPLSIQWSNFSDVFRIMKFSQVFVNSLYITLASAIGIVICSGMCGFSIVKQARKKYYNILYYVLIAGLMIPFYMQLSSLMKLMRDIGVMNSRTGLVITYIGRYMPFAVFLYTGFIRGVPNELSESAMIDGCSPLRTFWLIMFPITKHAASTLIILNSLTIWNDYLLPVLVLQSKKNQTIPIAQRYFYSEYNSQWNLAFASFIISMLPMMIFYFIMQKNIVEGIAAGAVKG